MNDKKWFVLVCEPVTGPADFGAVGIANFGSTRVEALTTAFGEDHVYAETGDLPPLITVCCDYDCVMNRQRITNWLVRNGYPVEGMEGFFDWLNSVLGSAIGTNGHYV